MTPEEIRVEKILNSLAKSKFRSSFHIRKYMINYIDEKGFDTIEKHAKDLITKKIGSAYPLNDGHQTPLKNHPVFIAMHATACCCRSCLYKWYNIPKGRELKKDEIDFLVLLVMTWIKKEFEKAK